MNGTTLNRQQRRAIRHTPAFVLARMTVAVYSPFFKRTHKRLAYITEQQRRLIALVQDGWEGIQRDLAELTGYTLGGVNDAIQALRALSILTISTTRGRHGRTRLALRQGVYLVNVRADKEERRIDTEKEKPRARTFRSLIEPEAVKPVALSEAPAAWRALRAALAP